MRTLVPTMAAAAISSSKTTTVTASIKTAVVTMMMAGINSHLSTRISRAAHSAIKTGVTRILTVLPAFMATKACEQKRRNNGHNPHKNQTKYEGCGIHRCFQCNRAFASLSNPMKFSTSGLSVPFLAPTIMQGDYSLLHHVESHNGKFLNGKRFCLIKTLSLIGHLFRVDQSGLDPSRSLAQSHSPAEHKNHRQQSGHANHFQNGNKHRFSPKARLAQDPKESNSTTSLAPFR